jgi:hypothetical protein
MRILILHRISNDLVRYQDGLGDHHDVTYIGVPDRMAALPGHLGGTRIVRPGTGDTAAEVLAAVSGLAPFDLVVALSEYDLLGAAQVREALGVNGDRVASVLPVRDKTLMKAAVAAAGLRVPRFAPLPAARAGGVPWAGPTIVKPVDGASSQDVFRYPSAAQALAAPVPGDPAGFQAEEFVDGPIVHVDGLMAGGLPVAIQASRYIGTCLGYADGDPLGSVQIDTGPELTAWALSCLAAVGIRDGLFHLEGFQTADGLVFLEVGARFGGGDIVPVFELATGVHLPSAWLRVLTGAPLPAPRETGGRYGMFVWPGHQLGAEQCEVIGAEQFAASPLVHRWVQRLPGEPISRGISYSDTDVPLAGIVGPGSPAALEDFLTSAFAGITVTAAGLAAATRR